MDDRELTQALVDQGLIRPEQAEECLRAAQECGAKILDLLVEKGYLQPDSIRLDDLAPRKRESATPAEAVEAAKDPSNRLRKYIRVAKLGEGGMGQVWKAWDTDLRRWVALKLLKVDDLERFRREAQTAAKLSHPNIAAVYEATDEYIAMQLIDGARLDHVPRDARKLVGLVRDAALAVHAAHEAGIVHRDLKPANILVEKGRAIVTDFGLAREIEVEASHAVVGTAHYMPPEQVLARPADARSDVWSLGVTLFHVLTGRVPFDGASAGDIFVRILSDEAPPMGRQPADLETAVAKCLEKDPSRRYATAREFADDLSRWLSGEPILAHPPSALYRLRKYVGRRKAIVATAAVALVALAIGGVFFVRQRLEHQRREAAQQRLATLWGTIVERKRDLRLDRSSTARPELREAIEGVSAHIAAWPDEPQGYYIRARARLYLGEHDEAIRDLERALAIRPDFKPAWSLLGMVRVEQYEQRLVGEPISARQRVLESRPFLAAAREAFAKGSLAREESERWGLPWTREDEVAFVLSRAHGLSDADAMRILREAFEQYRAEEYPFRLAQRVDDWGERLRWLDEAIRLAPGYVEAILDRGVIRGDAKDWDGAIADYDRALALRPESTGAHLNRGVARFAKGDTAGAIADYDRALELRPDWPAALINRGKTRLARGELEAAIEDLDRAIGFSDQYAVAYVHRSSAKFRLGRIDEALDDCERALVLDRANAVAWSNRAAARLAKNDLAGAKADYDRAIELDADLEFAWSGRGQAKDRLGDLEGAIADFDRSLAIRETPDVLNSRGLAKRRNRDLPGAIADFDRAIRLDPKFAFAWANRGDAKIDQQQWTSAREDFDQALKLQERFPKAYTSRAYVRENLGDVDGAIEDLDRAVEYDPNYDIAFLNRGAAKASKKDFAGAIADYDRAIAIRSDFLEAYVNRANAKRELRDYAGARTDYTRALEIAPRDWSPRKVVERWRDTLP